MRSSRRYTIVNRFTMAAWSIMATTAGRNPVSTGRRNASLT